MTLCYFVPSRNLVVSFAPTVSRFDYTLHRTVREVAAKARRTGISCITVVVFGLYVSPNT
jgi:predicted sugar kinase